VYLRLGILQQSQAVSYALAFSKLDGFAAGNANRLIPSRRARSSQ
jgi:hypothetical protein